MSWYGKYTSTIFVFQCPTREKVFSMISRIRNFEISIELTKNALSASRDMICFNSLSICSRKLMGVFHNDVWLLCVFMKANSPFSYFSSTVVRLILQSIAPFHLSVLSLVVERITIATLTQPMQYKLYIFWFSKI